MFKLKVIIFMLGTFFMTVDATFYVENISQENQDLMKKTGVWKPECPISMNRLRTVHFSHYTFEGRIKKGQMVVLDAVADYVQNIFQELYNRKFPIHLAQGIENFKGDDSTSMEANNSSAFNFRPIANTDKFSVHSYGLAIDLNPLQNPYIGHPEPHPKKNCILVEVWPSKSFPYVNRKHQLPGSVESVQDVFHQNGFREWGGDWHKMMDYHHFQTYQSVMELLTIMTPQDAVAFFTKYVQSNLEDIKDLNLMEKYQENPEDFMDKLNLYLKNSNN